MELKFDPYGIEREWEQILEKDTPLTQDDLSKLGMLAKKTRKFITYLMTNAFSSHQMKMSPRLISIEGNNQKIAKYEQIIAKLKDSEHQNNIEKQALEAEINSLKEQNRIKEEDLAKEKEWDSRINDVFGDLNRSINTLNNEETRTQCEFWGCTIILSLLIIAIIVYLYVMVCKMSTIKEPSLLKYSPWFTPLPFGVALFWVLIVLRNKANRYLLRIREEKFKITYIEGLVKAINKTSLSFDEGSKNITDILKSMVKSYSKQIEDSFIYESIKKERDTPIDASDIAKLYDKFSELLGKLKN